MHRFFAPDIASTLTLPEEESRHCVRVLRLVEGDEIEVIDGAGTLYRCCIAMAHAKHCAVEIVSHEACPPHWGSKIMIAVAPTKNLDRIEWMAEKCTEMGVTASHRSCAATASARCSRPSVCTRFWLLP